MIVANEQYKTESKTQPASIIARLPDHTALISLRRSGALSGYCCALTQRLTAGNHNSAFPHATSHARA